MKTDIAKQWVEALRSGNYQQGKRALCANDKYCCLGVLCDLAEKAGVVNSHTIDGERFYGEDELGGVLPQEVQIWSGISSDSGTIQSSPRSSLSGWNDKGDSFEKIALFIENNPHEL